MKEDITGGDHRPVYGLGRPIVRVCMNYEGCPHLRTSRPRKEVSTNRCFAYWPYYSNSTHSVAMERVNACYTANNHIECYIGLYCSQTFQIES